MTINLGSLTSSQATVLNAAISHRSLRIDWLVEAPDVGIKWSHTTNPDGTWEHRLASIGNIDMQVPPAGGVSTVSDVTVTAYESQAGFTGVRQRWTETRRLIGARLTITLLFLETGDTFLLFSGVLQTASIHNSIITLTAVDRSLPTNTLLPRTILTTAIQPNASPVNIGQPLPLVYGQGSLISAAPMLFTDTVQFTYMAAEHAFKVLGTTYAVFDDATKVFLPRDGDVTPGYFLNTLVFAKGVQELRFNPNYGSVYIQEAVDAINPQYLIDGNVSNIARIGTGYFASNHDGYGLIGVATALGAPGRGANTVTLSASAHRRAPGSDPTTTGQFILRTITAAVSWTPTEVSRGELFRSEIFRHTTFAQDSTFTIPSVEVGPTEAVEAVIYARHEGGPGNTSNAYEIGELTLTVFRQLTGDNPPVYLYGDWQGRFDDAYGTVTGTTNLVFSTFADVIGSLLTLELGETLHPTFWGSTRAYEVTNGIRADGGLGRGWAIERATAREVLDRLAAQDRAVLFIDYTGLWRLKPYVLPATPSQLDQSHVLFAYGETAGTDPERSSSLSLEWGRLEDVANSFEVHYGYHPGSGTYTQVAWANKDGTNLPTDPPFSTTFLTTLCRNSFYRYGPLPTRKVEAPFIYDATTAFWLLRHLVEYWYGHRLTIRFDVPLQIGVTFTPGDFFTLDHPELPPDDSGGMFELHGLSFQPSLGRTQLTASKISLDYYEYLRLNDQTGAPWYLLVDEDRQLRLFAAPPLSPLFGERDITPVVIPYWLSALDPYDSVTWFIWPQAGTLLTSTSPPPIGTGTPAAPVRLRGPTAETWGLRIDVLGTVYAWKAGPDTLGQILFGFYAFPFP